MQKKTFEASVFTDEVSGREITRLTDYKGHSHVQYFTDEYWINESRFIISSDRCGYSNLYVVDLSDRSVQQLTDLDGRDRPEGVYSRARGTFLFWYGNRLMEVDPADGAPRLIMGLGDNLKHAGGLHAVSPDGKTAYTVIRDAEPDGSLMRYNKSPDYLSSWREPVESRIVAVDVETGAMEIIYRDTVKIEHVNASPTDPDLLTFCHEGPWARVSQRIWGLQLDSGAVWPVRPQHGDLGIGHEFFTRDGKWVGYHGRRLPEEKKHTFGFVRPDNSEMLEHDFEYHCSHFVSYGLDLVLGDGTPANVQPWFPTRQKPYLMLFRRQGDIWEGPRVLAFHRATFNEQFQHPHARFSNDGAKVLYTSDVGGYSNVYMVETGDFESLPTVEECSVEW